MTRLEFHSLLTRILGSKFVYFQPPSKQKIYYPAIIYQRSPFDVQHADNHGYVVHDHYMVTHITKDPNSITPKALASLPNCRQDQAFKSDEMYHTVFSIYV